MFSLTRLAKGESYNDLHLKFGSNRDVMGSFFFVFVRHIYCHFYNKISGRLMEMWLDDVRVYFCKLIWEKVTRPTPSEVRKYDRVEINSLEELNIDFDTFCVFEYFNTTHVKTCRPGAGPLRMEIGGIHI